MSEVRAQTEPIPTPPPEPISPPVPTPEPVTEPPVTPEPTPPPSETPPAPATAEVPSTLRPSLLSEVEAPKAPEAPVFEPYNLPEGIAADEQQIGELNRIIAARDLTPQQQGQALVDLYVAEAQRLATVQHEVFNRTREEWRQEFFSDPELGGNRQDTSLRRAAEMLDRFGGTPEQRARLNTRMNHTGWGDTVDFIRFLNNVYAEVAAPRLIAAQGAAPAPTDGPSRRYPTMVKG